jgi:16S rRNA processing protein RimM
VALEKIYVCKVGKTVGLNGQLKLHIDSDFPEQFFKGATFLTNKNINLTIETFNKKNNLVKFVGFDNIDTSKKLINQQLFSTIQDTKTNCTLDENQFFWFDLIGCKIIENDKILGEVIEIHRYPISDYFEIQTQNKTFLLPYLPAYILNVDIEAKMILVNGAFDILEAS